MICLCGHPEGDHLLGTSEGDANRCLCGCPLWRPWRPFGHEDDDLADLRHQAAVDGLIVEHQLTTEVRVSGDEGAVFIDLPELPEEEG